MRLDCTVGGIFWDDVMSFRSIQIQLEIMYFDETFYSEVILSLSSCNVVIWLSS